MQCIDTVVKCFRIAIVCFVLLCFAFDLSLFKHTCYCLVHHFHHVIEFRILVLEAGYEDLRIAQLKFQAIFAYQGQ